jgi:hypothetical protein
MATVRPSLALLLLLGASLAAAQLHPTPELFKQWMGLGGEHVTGGVRSAARTCAPFPRGSSSIEER